MMKHLLQLLIITTAITLTCSVQANNTSSTQHDLINNNTETYVVKAGDSLSKIAAKQLIGFKAYMACIQARNHINNPNHITPGQKLVLPSIKECQGNEATYQLCSGDISHQSCQPFANKNACESALKSCQNAKNQVKPWLCGSCQQHYVVN
ncbi:LysM peptidoglycan-binding domain-containing protein [Cysteiniphilum halobium]|uniref:LysM peptidoglycan-binding domain-containing protein n=1 Tax=Cysteiniphilum halobium TaxID=2219059 RepID=UPI000E64A389|nr:LysM peptidoglycan-binding domain-containing protein [Cysteiniphilum halobium]